MVLLSFQKRREQKAVLKKIKWNRAGKYWATGGEDYQ